MERVNRIIKHELFLENVRKNEEAEVDRHFCRHNMSHFLDVARIGQIMNLEEDLGLDHELVYAAALLHDIGRHDQYETGIPHEQASALRAPQILKDCGFTEKETERIVSAIRKHRDQAVAGETSLEGLLYRADKASRACFSCQAQAQCNWKGDKKNKWLRY